MDPCDWCGTEVPVTWWVRDGDAEERVCSACHSDWVYCLAGGRIPQEED